MDYAVEEFMDYCDDIIMESYTDPYYPAYEGLKEIGQSAVGAIQKAIAKLKQIIRNIMARATAKNFMISTDVLNGFFKIADAVKKEILNVHSTVEDARVFVSKVKESTPYKNLEDVAEKTFGGGFGIREAEYQKVAGKRNAYVPVSKTSSDAVYKYMKKLNGVIYEIEKKYANREVSKEEKQRVLILLNFLYSTIVLLNRKGLQISKKSVQATSESFIDFMEYCDDIIMESYLY